MTDVKMMTVLVCGGRDYFDRERVYRLLSFNRAKIAMIVHGAAKGADSMADQWAEANRVPCLRVPAEWEKFGKKAGFIRNEKMLSFGKPDLVVAFPGGVGTAMMVRLAKQAGVRVIEVPVAPPPKRRPLTEEEIDAGVEYERSVLNHCEEENPRVRNDRLNAEALLRYPDQDDRDGEFEQREAARERLAADMAGDPEIERALALHDALGRIPS